MAEIGVAMVTLLTDNWAGAGAAPTFGHLLTNRGKLAPTAEQVIVRVPNFYDDDPFNDKFSNIKHTLLIRTKTNVSIARLTVLVNEVIRIVKTYAITNIQRQRVKNGEHKSDKQGQIFIYDLWVVCEEHMSAGGTSYSSPGAGDVALPAALTVVGNTELTGDLSFDTGEHVDVILDEDDMASDDEDALATQQSIKKYVDDMVLSDLDVTITGAYLEDLLMFGSANAAWVPCPLEAAGAYTWGQMTALGYFTNLGNNNMDVVYAVPLPTSKGGLKLYISGTRVHLDAANGTNFINNTTVYRYSGGDRNTVDADATNKDAAGEHEDTFTAVDCSGSDIIKVSLDTDVADAGALDIHGVQVKAYYAA